MTGFVTSARVRREAGEGAANEDMQDGWQLTQRPKHVLFIGFAYIWKLIRTPS